MTAWINRGMVYKRKGDLGQSIADFTDAIKCLPANGPVVGGASLDPAGKPFPAAHYQGIAKSTQLADAHYQRAMVYLDKGGKDKAQATAMYDAAIKDFNEAIRINPTAAAHFVGRASTYMYKQMFQPAIADFTVAIKLSPGDEYTYLHRGIAYHSVNEPDKAIDDYTEANKINPLTSTRS